jgi:hypothetical protein
MLNDLGLIWHHDVTRQLSEEADWFARTSLVDLPCMTRSRVAYLHDARWSMRFKTLMRFIRIFFVFEFVAWRGSASE